MTHFPNSAPNAAISLSPAHAQQLAKSAIAESIIAERGYHSIAPGAAQEVRELTSDAYSKDLLRLVLRQGALAFPIYQLGDPTPYTWVLRPELPRPGKDGKPIKYEWPRNIPNVFDLLPIYRDALNDPTVPIWITEGGKKADALASAYDRQALPINLNGVWGWRGRGDKGGKAALADMEMIAWEGRQVVIAPDGDVKDNPHVAKAVQRLARLLLARYGVAELLICYLPQQRGGPKIGVDDYLAAGHTTQDLESLLVPLDAVANGARVAFSVHPETGEQLMLLTFTNIGAKIFPDATKAMVDMATSMNNGMTPSSEQLSKQAIMLGKALNDPIAGASALRKVGVTLSEQQRESIKDFMAVGDIASAQSVILQELQKEFGGAAEAAGKTFSGCR